MTLAPIRIADRARRAVEPEPVWSPDVPVAAIVSFRSAAPMGRPCRPPPGDGPWNGFTVAERNLALAQAHFSLPALVERLGDLLGRPKEASSRPPGEHGRQEHGRTGA